MLGRFAWLSNSLGLKPFAGSLSEQTQVRYRWYKDVQENRVIKRYGYKDPIKREGPLPRLKDDTADYRMVASYKPTNSWAEHRALAGQNDYIDILGSEEIHPKHIMYHVPNYLKGVHKRENHFQMQIKRKAALEHTPFPKAFPSKWQGWKLTMAANHRWLNRHVDQNWWANYKGVKEGPVKNPFKPKLF